MVMHQIPPGLPDHLMSNQDLAEIPSHKGLPERKVLLQHVLLTAHLQERKAAVHHPAEVVAVAAAAAQDLQELAEDNS